MVVVVVDNGGCWIKAGMGGDGDPCVVVPNCQARISTARKWLLADQLQDPLLDITSATVRRPIDRGYLINVDLQRDIWSHIFTNLLQLDTSTASLLLTIPHFTLPSITRSVFELVFEDFAFPSLFLSDCASLVHLYEASNRPRSVLSLSRCGLVVDCGFSFTHVAPVFQNFTLNYAVKRLDLGGKALSNYLKELVSYRSVNVMDESLIMDDVKEKLCFLSLDIARDLQIARKRGRNNFHRCTYVLPDGVTHMRGFIKDSDESRRFEEDDMGSPKPDTEVRRFDEKRRIDLTTNQFSLTNERFLVPEMIFHPADLGINRAGLAESIVSAVNCCHPYLHPILYQSIILTGGSTLFPQFSQKLEMELRPLIPDKFQLNITHQEDPISGVWRGGSLLASSPNFDAICVTKSEYEELGSARCMRRFFI